MAKQNNQEVTRENRHTVVGKVLRELVLR